MPIKTKRITKQEFEPIMERDWRPVELSYDTLPSWMKTIPEDQRKFVFASGSDKGILNNGEEEVGGVDVFRDAINHPETVDWNKDHYTVVRDSTTDYSLLMYGPIKDYEHWINEIPKRLKDVEFLEYFE